MAAYVPSLPVTWDMVPAMEVDIQLLMREGPSPPWIETNGYAPAECNVLDTPDFEFLASSDGLISNDCSSSCESDDSTDPDWDGEDSGGRDSPSYHSVTDKSRLQKNQKERERVQMKKESLKKLVEYCRESNLIPCEDKKRRFTEAYTIKMTTMLIQRLEQENERLGGVKGGAAPKPRRKRSVKKPSNSFIKFSTSLRPTFVRVLMSTSHAEDTVNKVTTSHPAGGRRVRKNPSQKVVQKLAAEVWNRLPPEAKHKEWGTVERDEQLQLTKIAQDVVASDWGI